MRYKMTKKYQIRRHKIRFFFKRKIHQNTFSVGRGSAQDPARAAYDAPPADPLVGWGGEGNTPSPFPFPSTRRL